MIINKNSNVSMLGDKNSKYLTVSSEMKIIKNGPSEEIKGFCL